LDKRFAGIVEAWASGVSWQELIEHSGMDEGDAARLLRQTLDLISQVPFYQISCRTNYLKFLWLLV
jgi:superfamily II RNA helicase